MTQKKRNRTTKSQSQKNIGKNSQIKYIKTTMEETLATKREGAEVKNRTRSYIRYKKYAEAIHKASGEGRCWWIAEYLKHTLKY